MRTQTIRQLVLTGILATLIFSPAMLSTTRAQTAPAGFADLAAGLKATPGCLGVEAARTASGKQVLFAWFENKTAALKWYYSDTHRAAMQQFFPNAPAHAPMADVPDDGSPILAIASVTMAGDGAGARGTPFSQIAIELYHPLSGGIALGGRFAPDTVTVPGLRVVPSSGGTRANQQ
jgi:quinol monooxygenase YgiN